MTAPGFCTSGATIVGNAVRVTMIVVGVSASIIGGVTVIAVIIACATVSDQAPASPSRSATRTTAAG